MSDLLIEARDLVRIYRVPSAALFSGPRYIRAVDGVSLQVRKGKTLGLVGESGCGKSTVGKLLAGLEKPDGGTVSFHGSDGKAGPQMIFQDAYSSLNPRKRIRDILAEPLRYRGMLAPGGENARIRELLDMVGLPDNTAGKYPHELSGGQRQRVCIAGALSVDPEFIVCDEPVSALDVSIQAQILNLLKDLQRELGIGMLFIGHGLATVRYVSHDIAVMYLSRLVETAPAEELFRNPVHPYTKALLAAVPTLDLQADPFGKPLLTGEAGDIADPPAGCRFHPRCTRCSDRCVREIPELMPAGEGHMAACHCCAGKEAGS